MLRDERSIFEPWLDLVRSQRVEGKRAHDARLAAAHASARTTKLYDRRADLVTLDEIERITI